ncbi:hypothetical protein HAX54_043113 [Datura stramonium]|uniref:Uncharacterized protein n=1 Tax=Datura stramonium TaxID=4076 RepID=A0ABS8SN71_DATST|nr:hypothetical protein [Datura stramonium]
MVLEISLIDLKKVDPEKEYNDTKWIYDPYNVYVDEHRILSIVSGCYKTTTKWFKELQKTASNNKHGCIHVAICVERDPEMIQYHWNQPNREETPYNLLKVCTGSHCLLYRLPFPHDHPIPKAMKAFFTDPRVMTVGMNMRAVMMRLEADHGIKFANPVDINNLAVKGMQRDDLDLGRYDLNRLAKTVLGKHWDVIRPVGPLPWFPPGGHWWRDKFNPEKVEYATVDTYLCFMISSKILDGMDDKWLIWHVTVAVVLPLVRY